MKALLGAVAFIALVGCRSEPKTAMRWPVFEAKTRAVFEAVGPCKHFQKQAKGDVRKVECRSKDGTSLIFNTTRDQKKLRLVILTRTTDVADFEKRIETVLGTLIDAPQRDAIVQVFKSKEKQFKAGERHTMRPKGDAIYRLSAASSPSLAEGKRYFRLGIAYDEE